LAEVLNESVITLAAGKRIISGTAFQGVFTRASYKTIISGTAIKSIVALVTS